MQQVVIRGRLSRRRLEALYASFTAQIAENARKIGDGNTDQVLLTATLHAQATVIKQLAEFFDIRVEDISAIPDTEQHEVIVLDDPIPTGVTHEPVTSDNP